MPHYQVHVEGCLGPQWAAWFEPLDVRPQPDGTTLLIGVLADQAALHGLLAKVRDLGIALLSVVQIHDPSPSAGRCGTHLK